MLKYYKMVYQKPRVQELNCSLEDAFEIAREDFAIGNSCCQVIIDEESRTIFSLLDSTYLSEDFKYKLENDDYHVYDAGCFYDINDIKLINTNYQNKRYDTSLDCAYYV